MPGAKAVGFLGGVHLRAGMGKVRHGASWDHVRHHLTAELRQRRVALTVEGFATGVVDERVATGNPVPRHSEPVEIGQVALKRMRPLGSRNAVGHLLASLPRSASSRFQSREAACPTQTTMSACNARARAETG